MLKLKGSRFLGGISTHHRGVIALLALVHLPPSEGEGLAGRCRGFRAINEYPIHLFLFATSDRQELLAAQMRVCSALSRTAEQRLFRGLSRLRGQTGAPCSVRYWVETCLSTAICVDFCILLPICQDVARTGIKQYMGRPSCDEVAFFVLRDQALLIGVEGSSSGWRHTGLSRWLLYRSFLVFRATETLAGR